MKIVLQLIVIIICSNAMAQNSTTVEKQKDTVANSKTKVVKPATSGISKFYNYISNNFKTPYVTGFSGGKEIVEFTIKTDGTIKDVKIIKDVGYGVGEQIKKILLNSPKWSPGIKNGQPVECTYRIPIKIPGSDDDN